MATTTTTAEHSTPDGRPLYIIGRAMPPRNGDSQKRTFFKDRPNLAGKDVLDKEQIKRMFHDTASYPGGCPAKVSLVDEHVWGSQMHQERADRIGSSDHMWLGKDGTVHMLGQIHHQGVAKQVESGEKTGLSTWLELDLSKNKEEADKGVVTKHELWHIAVTKNPRHPMARILWKGRDVNEALALTQMKLADAEAQTGTLDPLQVVQRVPGQRLQLDRIGSIMKDDASASKVDDPMDVDADGALDYGMLTMRNVPKSMLEGIMDSNRKHPNTKLRFGIANANLDTLDVTVIDESPGSEQAASSAKEQQQQQQQKDAPKEVAGYNPVVPDTVPLASVSTSSDSAKSQPSAETQPPADLSQQQQHPRQEQMQAPPPVPVPNSSISAPAAAAPAANPPAQQQQPQTNGSAAVAKSATPSLAMPSPPGNFDNNEFEQMLARRIADAVQKFAAPLQQQQQQQQPIAPASQQVAADTAANAKKREREEPAAPAEQTDAKRHASGTDVAEPAGDKTGAPEYNTLELALMGNAQRTAAKQMEDFKTTWAPELEGIKEEADKKLLAEVIEGTQKAYVESYMDLLRKNKLEQANNTEVTQFIPAAWTKSLQERRAARLAMEAEEAKKQIEMLRQENEALKNGKLQNQPGTRQQPNRPPPVSTMVKDMNARMDQLGQRLAELTAKERHDKIQSGAAVAAAASADPMSVDGRPAGKVSAEEANRMHSSVEYLHGMIGLPNTIGMEYLDMISRNPYDNRTLSQLPAHHQLMVLRVAQKGQEKLMRNSSDMSTWSLHNKYLPEGMTSRPLPADDSILTQ
jgi:hypothetical protein